MQRASTGDQDALAEVFSRYRERLRRMVRLRIDRRLQGRVDASDVFRKRISISRAACPTTPRDPKMPFYLWLRFLTGQLLSTCIGSTWGQRCATLHRRCRCTRPLPQASSVSLAAQLRGG